MQGVDLSMVSRTDKKSKKWYNKIMTNPESGNVIKFPDHSIKKPSKPTSITSDKLPVRSTFVESLQDYEEHNKIGREKAKKFWKSVFRKFIHPDK